MGAAFLTIDHTWDTLDEAQSFVAKLLNRVSKVTMTLGLSNQVHDCGPAIVDDGGEDAELEEVAQGQVRAGISSASVLGSLNNAIFASVSRSLSVAIGNFILTIVFTLFFPDCRLPGISLFFSVKQILLNAWAVLTLSVVSDVASIIILCASTATDIKDVLKLFSIVAQGILLSANISHVLAEKASFSTMTAIIGGP